MTVFAIAAPTLLILTAGAVQYTSRNEQGAVLQAAADAAAIGAAKQLNLAGSFNLSSTSAVATAIARATLANRNPKIVDQVLATPIDSNTGVLIKIVRSEPALFGAILGSNTQSITVQATAHAYGGAPVCAIALDSGVRGAITLDSSAVVSAERCAVYSDSKDNLSIVADQSAVLRTALTCAVGGKKGLYPNFLPSPKTGCPVLADPLASRVPPAVSGCDFTNLVITGSHQYLNPGVYCGGLKVTSGATVTLASGTYVMEGGPLDIEGGSTLTGENVGFYLTKYLPGVPPAPKINAGPGPATVGPAPGTTIYFAQDSTISLTAPKSGAMAGLLFFEDRKLPKNQLHQILSNNAQTLLGTVYLPQGRLFIGSNAPVAASSAYTVVVADTLELSSGPTLVLNSDYGATDIPVPDGVGPNPSLVVLTQ